MAAGGALSLIKAVLELVAERRTGVLEVRADGLRTQITFDAGKPVFAEDEAPGESFGRLLMRQGVITNDQFVRVIDEMTRAAAGNNQLRFGEVAVGLGVLTPEQVERGLAEQVCGIITRALQRGDSQWTFEASPAARLPPRSFSLAIAPTVLEALRQSTDQLSIAKAAAAVAARPEEFVVVAGAQPARADDPRTADEAHGTRMAAEQAFQKGMALLRDNKAASAAIELRRAAELQPESLEFQLYATWAKARSYRDVPVESDQQALLEIAQRAKKRDPLFAFASYVIGQVSMWAGDDAAAKKWFYEALRIDPSSEAGAQVRILARRGAPAAEAPPPTEAPPPVAEAPPPPVVEPPEPAPVTSAEPPPSAPAADLSPQAPSRRRSGWLVPVVTVFAIAGMAILAVARQALLDAQPAPSPIAQPSLAVDASAPLIPEPAEAFAATSAEREPKAMHEQDAEEPDGEMGTVLLPSRASGHRIFIDGRRSKVDEKTDGPEPLRLRCGRHAIQIGSSGTPEPIDVPCGGEVQLQ